MNKKIGKKEIIVLAVIFAAALIALFAVKNLQTESGGQVTVTVDGEVYGTYDMDSKNARTVDIKDADGNVTNTFVIQDGTADMISADCPDKLCVDQHAISAVGETIVCLPNKVVLEVTDGEESAFDTMTQ